MRDAITKGVSSPTADKSGIIFSFTIGTGSPVVILDSNGESENSITFRRDSDNKLAMTQGTETNIRYLNVGEYITIFGSGVTKYLQYIAFGSPVVLLLTTLPPSPIIPCLLKGTLVLTPYGFIKIEDLTEGQQITTHKGIPKRIVKIFHKHVRYSLDPFIDEKMYRVDGQQPLYISHWHKILRTDGLLCAGHLQLPLASKEELCGSNDTFEIYHIQLNDSLSNHLVVNNGIIVESWSGL